MDKYHEKMIRIEEELSEGEKSLDTFPDDTEAVLAAFRVTDDGESIIDARDKITRSDIADLMPPEIGLNKDQVKYRMEKLVEHDMAVIDWRDNPETRTPTAYYSLTEHGKYLAKRTRTVQNLLGPDPEEITKEDIHTLVGELEKTRIRVDGLSQQLLELEERLEQQEEENEDEGGTTGFGPR